MEVTKSSLISEHEEGKRDTLPLTGEEMAKLHLSMKAQLEEERAKKSNLTLQVAQDRWRKAEERVDHLEATVERLVKAGEGMYTAFDALMPGLANISLNDYSVINDNPIEWKQAKKAAEELMDV